MLLSVLQWLSIQLYRALMMVYDSLTQSSFFWTLTIFLKKRDFSEAGSASVFRQRSTYSGGPLRLSCSQSLGLLLFLKTEAELASKT